MNDQEEKFFVNRHGKRVSSDGAVFDEPPVAEKIAEPTRPPVAQPVSVPKPKKIQKVRNKKPIKKLMLTLLAALLILLLVPIAGGELVRARYLSSREGARTQLVEYANQTVVPQQKKQVKLAQLSGAADQVEKIRDDACDGGFTDNLAMIYPGAKEAYEQCIAFKQKVATVAVNLRDMENQVRYLEALAPVIEPVAKDTSEGFAIISAQHENWRTLDEALGKLSPSASQRAAHDKLKSQSKAIVDAWSALNTANNNQNAAAFADAEKKLGEAYEALRSSSAVFAGIMNETQTKLTASYKAL